MDNALLLVVDVQNGFLNSRSEHVVPRVLKALEKFRIAGLPVAFTRFINRPDSPYVQWIHWSRLMAAPEIDLSPSLEVKEGDRVFDKYGYTAFSAEFTAFILEKGIQTLVICGIATDGCILKTAVDAFETSVQPIVVSDACASHAGEDVHKAGLLLISRFIGRDQVRTLDEVVKSIPIIGDRK
jgi:nicotinamidase-related amidase